MSEFLKCDAAGCDHTEDVDAITAELVGKPCPKCGASLLTEADWAMYSTVFQPAMRAMFDAGIARPAPAGTPTENVVRVGYHEGELTIRTRLASPPPREREMSEREIAEPAFAFPMDEAPKDGQILRLLVKFDRNSAAGPFEDTTEPSWTIGSNSRDNTGDDRWDIVGWSWEQDVFCHAYGATAIGWLPFHPDAEEFNRPKLAPPPSVKAPLNEQ